MAENAPAIRPVAIDKRFIINRQGKDFVLYAGLLDYAHALGLRSIRTALVECAPELVVFKATVEMGDGRVFEGYGDATPQNVGPTIKPHFLRMGETRAKARALRDATNIGMAALEELGGDDAPVPASESAGEPGRATPPHPPAAPSARARAIAAGMDAAIAAADAGLPSETLEPVTEQTRLLCAAFVDAVQAANPKVKPKLPPQPAGDAAWRSWLEQKTAEWAVSPHNPAIAASPV